MSSPMPTFRRGLLALAAALAVGAPSPAARAAAASTAPLPKQVTFSANPAQPASAVDDTWTVPDGVTEATFYVAGGAGGAGAGGADGGGGGDVEATVAVVPGETFDVVVGGSGANGSGAAAGATGLGGVGGAPGGGHGGDGEADPTSLPALGGGGGGGGQSSVTLATGGEATLELVAPGGGGGGATAGSADDGGAGGAGAISGSADERGDATGGAAGGATAAGAGGVGPTPGAAGGENRGGDAAAGSGAGGGGDGFFGAGSGAGAADGGAGGGGGGFYLASGVTGSEHLSPSTVGSVAIGYAPPPAPPPPPPPQPHVAIVGTPALAEPLTCSVSNVPAGASVAVGWLRDGTPIAGASGLGYTIAPVDEGNYLQCSVTATSATGTGTATSAFVAIPVQGLQAAVATTTVTAPHVHGAAVSVVARCSPRAALRCVITLSLSVVEYVRAGRLVAVSAAAQARKAAARRTITVGARTFALAPGAQRTLAVALTPAGLRLFASEGRLPVRLLVSGTLVGALSATLLDESLALGTERRATSRLGAPLAALGLGPAATPALAAPLAATPYMGWDTYLAFGGQFNEATILDEAHELIARGLEKAGYRYIWFDAGWWLGARDANGNITVNPAQWPHGLAWLTAILHRAGFLVGLYTDAGPSGCGGAGAGSYGHYQQDANTFAAWGFDAVKVDFCGGVRIGLNPQAAYTAFHEAIVNNASHRPMLLNVCNFLQPGQFASGIPAFDGSSFSTWTYAPAIANSWRTDTDVGSPHHLSFPSVLRNADADAAHPQAAGPGHWNDPDYVGPDQGLTGTQLRTQMSTWSMLAAPLMISDDLDTMSAASQSIVSNPEVIAIDQDPAGVQGTLVASAGNAEVWVKPLSDGSRAVALLNRGPAPLQIGASAAGVGLPRAARYTVRDVWAHRTTTTTGTVLATVPGDGTMLYRMSAAPAAKATR